MNHIRNWKDDGDTSTSSNTNLQDRIMEIISTAAYDGDFKPNTFSDIEEAFKDNGYMTGKQWYDNFYKEVMRHDMIRAIEQENGIFFALGCAKKVSGMK